MGLRMQLADHVRAGTAELALPEPRERFAIAPLDEADDALAVFGEKTRPPTNPGMLRSVASVMRSSVSARPTCVCGVDG